MPSSNQNIRILIIDDDEDDFFITSEYLKTIPGKDWTIDWCFKYAEALEIMRDAKYDVYFVDYRLGAKTGIDLIKEAVSINNNRPFILLTGKGDVSIDVEAMKLGAFDYLVKAELSPEKLERSIRYSIDRANTLSELRAKEKKYRNIFDKSGEAIFVTDEHLFFTEINNAFCELLNCDANSLDTVCLADIISYKKHAIELISKLTENDMIDDFEVEIKYKNSETRQCVLSASKEITTEGVYYYQGILHDITFIREAEKATLQAEKLAATGRLVRTLAHEVRNPINNIHLSVEQLRMRQQEEDRLYLDIIYRNSDRINDLIKELLNISGPEHMQKAEESMHAVINQVITPIMDRIQLKNIQLEIYEPDEDFIIRCDSSKLAIALLNILVNAVEAIENNEGVIKIKVAKENKYVVIKITDNGTGIAPDHMTRLFEPYFTSKRNGIGLGLAATSNIIQAHKGTIDVQSEINSGTSFTVKLPL